VSGQDRATAPREWSAETARVQFGVALSLVELAAQVLQPLPAPELALRRGDRELYRALQGAETVSSWLVGHQEGDSVDHPGRGSALGDGQRIYGWSDEETARQFESALSDWSERQ